MDDVIIKDSSIRQFPNGLGVFANRDFMKGEVVIQYNLRVLSEEEFERLSDEEKLFTHKRHGIIFLYPIPARYVNHSKKPNTIQNFTQGYDIAVWDIKKGEEITTDATREDF